MPRGRAEKFPELRAYVNEHAGPDVTRAEMVEMAQRDINPGVAYEHVRRIYLIDRLPALRGYKRKQLIPDEKAEAFMKLIPGRSSIEIARLAREELGIEITTRQIRTWKKNHKTASGYDSRFRAGRLSQNKGMTWNDFMSPEAQERSRLNQYKKGHVPKNRKELGEVYLRSDGYVWIKVQDGTGNRNWTQYHRYVWEQNNGPVPEGHKLIFLDGDRTNCRIENLMLVSDGVLSTANKWFGLGKEPEINKAIVKAAELKVATGKAIKRRKHETD